MSDELVAFLNARLEEDERIARAASGRDADPVSEPEEWRWECCEDDQPLDVDLAIAGGEETLVHGEHYNVGLRSVQEYPTRSVGPLSHLVLSDECVRPQDARHIARHDPARVLREVEAKRAILGLHYPGLPPAGAPDGLTICAGEEADGDTWQMATSWPCHTVCVIAAVYSDHPDYRPEWKP